MVDSQLSANQLLDQKSVESQLTVDQDVNWVLTKVSVDCQFSIDLTSTEGQMPLTVYVIQQANLRTIQANLCFIQASLGAI